MGASLRVEPLDARASALGDCMCGIAGVAGLDRDHGGAAVRLMSDAITHRGPDDSGEFSVDGLAFGMRRLSIIDLGHGHQPIWTNRGTGIIFNGEIYNYRELRRELAQRGVQLKTQSDTEVIVQLYDLDGVDCIQRLEGMFAICLYDPQSRQIHLIRDRLGKKPLYYGEIDGAFYFASELKAILAALESRPQIEPQAIYDFLTLRYVPGPATIWRGLQSLEPGTRLTFGLDDRKLTQHKFWSVEFHSEPFDRKRDYADEFLNLFRQAVQKRLVAADVPVGILLSGGIDSSAVAATAAELGHDNLHTFSVAFDEGGDADETPFARLVAGSLGTRHSEVTIGRREFIDFLPQFVKVSDQPLADLASIPLYFVSKRAKRDVKVVLSGEGADEVLAGYDMENLARQFDLMALMAGMPAKFRVRLADFATHLHRPLAGAVLRDGARSALGSTRAHMTRVWDDKEKDGLWRGPRLKSTDDLIKSWYDNCASPNPIDQMQQVYCRSWLVEDLLMKADKMSMAASLELRCPFLDHDLVEWSARLPLAWKVGSRHPGYSSKRILRDYAAKLLPAAIINRPKRGFPVPAYRWLEADLGKWAWDRISSRRLGSWADVQTLEPVLIAAQQGAHRAQHQIWNLLILDYWLEAWA
jgi:asparagine synthase (glutamine-hydrolysing)